MENKSHKSRSVLITLIASLVVISAASASLMTGCQSSDSSTPDEAEVGTSIVTKTIEGTYYVLDDEGSTVIVENGTDAEGNVVIQNGTDPSGKKVTVENGTDPQGRKVIEIGKTSSGSNSSEPNENSKTDSDKSSSKSDSKSESSQKSDKEQSSQSSKDNNRSDNIDSSSALVVGNQKYAVGDTVTCVYSVKIPEKIEDFQAKITYDGDYLSVEDAYLSDNADKGSTVLNYELKDEIRFNGVFLKGYNFTDEAAFITVEFKVKDTGEHTPTFVWECASGVSGKAYVEDNEMINGMEMTVDYS